LHLGQNGRQSTLPHNDGSNAVRMMQAERSDLGRHGSDPAEVEQVALGIHGEADALEKAFVTEEVGASPLRADEDRGIYVEGFSFVSRQCNKSSVEPSTKPAETCAQHHAFLGRDEGPLKVEADFRLKNTPRVSIPKGLQDLF